MHYVGMRQVNIGILFFHLPMKFNDYLVQNTPNQLAMMSERLLFTTAYLNAIFTNSLELL